MYSLVRGFSAATTYSMKQLKFELSYDVASGSEITPCNKIDKPLVVYRFTGIVMTSISRRPFKHCVKDGQIFHFHVQNAGFK